MRRGRGLVLADLSALIAFAAGSIAWNGIQIYESDLNAVVTFLLGVAVGVGGAWAWRNWRGRAMVFEGRTLDSITDSDAQTLVTNAVPEHGSVEYKGQLPGNAGTTITRRGLFHGVLCSAVLLALGACGASDVSAPNGASLGIGAMARAGRIVTRPAQMTGAITAGLQTLGLTHERDALLYVPASYVAERPAPFVLVLHGAGSIADDAIWLLGPLAEETGTILLAPSSLAYTWDLMLGGFGADVEEITRALTWAFARCALDPARLAVAGFSDGASYALALGLTNGDLFTHLIAFSPGFSAPGELRGHPHIYVSHGRQDATLPIEQCSRRIVPALEADGYDVRYHEFDGGHAVPPEISREAIEWLIGDQELGYGEDGA